MSIFLTKCWTFRDKGDNGKESTKKVYAHTNNVGKQSNQEECSTYKQKTIQSTPRVQLRSGAIYIFHIRRPSQET